MFDQLLRGDFGTAPTNIALFIIGILLAFACGFSIATTYMLTHSGLSYSRSYVGTLVLMPILVALVMMILANNLVMAFGLMAIFAMVRFRSILRDTLDTAYVLAVIVIGLACGTLKFSSAIMGCSATLLFMFFFWVTGFGTRHRYDLVLNVQWLRSPTELESLRDMLDHHCLKVQCTSQRSSDSYEGLNLSYWLLLRDPSRSEELYDDIRRIEGVAQVSGMQAQDESEI